MEVRKESFPEETICREAAAPSQIRMSVPVVEDSLLNTLDALRRAGRITLSAVASGTGINRSMVSQFANGKYRLDEEQRDAIRSYIAKIDSVNDADRETYDAPEVSAAVPTVTPAVVVARRFGLGGKIHYTRDYGRAVGRLDEVRAYRAMCVMIGHPGTGKTTVLREYTRTHEDTYYINCWPVMSVRDLLEAIAAALGITLKNGSRYRMIQQIADELSNRPGAMLIYDEAENLRGENVKKLEVLRKLCDDSDTACVLAGTYVLEEALTHGGNGRLNLAQIYRRNLAIPMDGVSVNEVNDMLTGYDVDTAARAELTKIATDVRHGGLGNFVEILNICLNIADGSTGGIITRNVLRDAMKYKLMPR